MFGTIGGWKISQNASDAHSLAQHAAWPVVGIAGKTNCNFDRLKNSPLDGPARWSARSSSSATSAGPLRVPSSRKATARSFSRQRRSRHNRRRSSAKFFGISAHPWWPPCSLGTTVPS
jgi:hypothetical protein